MRALLEIDARDPDAMIKAIEPDVEPTDKFDVRLEAGVGKLVVEVESRTAGGLLAGVNSLMRMVKAVKEVEDVE